MYQMRVQENAGAIDFEDWSVWILVQNCLVQILVESLMLFCTSTCVNVQILYASEAISLSFASLKIM